MAKRVNVGMLSTPFTLDVFPVEQETLKAEEFLRLGKTNPGLIKSSAVVPPKPVRSGFGSFLVR